MGTIIKYLSAFLLILFVSSQALAQNTDSEDPRNDPRYKDPNTSQLLGVVIIGGGHFYSGEAGTGAILLGSAILAPVIGAAIATNNVDNSLQTGNTSSVTGPVYAGIAVTLGAWIYSIVDSPKAARRTNEENGLTLGNNIELTPSMLTTKTKNTGYGVTMKIDL